MWPKVSVSLIKKQFCIYRKNFMQVRAFERYMSRDMGFRTMWYGDQQSLRSACAYAQSNQSLCWSFEYSISVKLLTEHNLEFLSLKGGCTCSSESTLVKIQHCWKSHVTAHIPLISTLRSPVIERFRGKRARTLYNAVFSLVGFIKKHKRTNLPSI